MPNLINRMVVRELNEAFESAESLVFVSLSGLTVAETEALRSALAERGVRLRMVRNRLARLALSERGFEAPEGMLVGNVACVWGGPEDAIHAAKVLHESDARRGGKVELRGGMLEGNLLAASDAVALASLPGREELRAKLLGTIQAPLQRLVSLAQAPQAALARVLQARLDAAPEGQAEGAA